MGVPEHEIAVVTPYQAQVSLISGMIHEDHPTMTIGSVDGLQGQEREVCCLTFHQPGRFAQVEFRR
jgi:DNA polymerase alpha-associated DNA helicase A